MEGVGSQAGGAGTCCLVSSTFFYGNVTGHTFMADREGQCMKHWCVSLEYWVRVCPALSHVITESLGRVIMCKALVWLMMKEFQVDYNYENRLYRKVMVDILALVLLLQPAETAASFCGIWTGPRFLFTVATLWVCQGHILLTLTFHGVRLTEALAAWRWYIIGLASVLRS